MELSFYFLSPPYRCTFRLEWHFVFGIEEHAHRDTHGYVAVSICCGQRFSRELLENFILFKAPKQKAIFACQEQQHRHPQYPDPAAASTMAKRLSIGNQKIATDHWPLAMDGMHHVVLLWCQIFCDSYSSRKQHLMMDFLPFPLPLCTVRNRQWQSIFQLAVCSLMEVHLSSLCGSLWLSSPGRHTHILEFNLFCN